MYLIAGLGNPGEKYKYTRHNVGFMTIDYLSAVHGIKVKKIKFRALIGEGMIGGEKVLLAKPSTFMNLSGESIAPMAEYFKIPKDKIIVIYDDVALPTGKLRIRPSGSDGGHNGMKSVIYMLETEKFPRIRIGIGNTGEIPMADFVTGTFSKEDGEKVTSCIKQTDKIISEIIENGVESAMNKFNGMSY
ncbi:MAG: aminoacyl-tRNA hydrolase [Clostridia bacterium]|nr:aminoacyl-tRNA hydrolase [Clostridia bacterium]